MKARLLVSKEDGRRCLYVPEAHIQFDILKVNEHWIVSAFRTDGYYGRTREEAIPTIEHLQQKYQFTVELEVPPHIVHFAVESERRRQESVEGISEILSQTVRSGDHAIGFKEFMAQLGREKLDKDFDENAEHKIGEEIHQLMQRAGGLL
jgi:hypothetical protein